MPLNIQDERRQAHDFLDRLPDEQVRAARSLLEAMGRPDDEPVTEEDHRRIAQGDRSLAERGGRGVEMSEVLADFGLTEEDFKESK